MKKPNLIFRKIKPLLILCLSVSIFSSCTVTKDDDAVPEDEEITFKVDLIKLTALEIKDAEGEKLEVYGQINTTLITDEATEDNSLWSTVETAAVGVGLSDLPMSSSVTYKVPSSELSNSEIKVEADLFDYDGGGDNSSEDLGKESLSTPLAGISSSVTYQIVLNDSSGQTMQVTYSITRL